MSFGKQLTATQMQNRHRKSRSASRGKMQNHHTPPRAHEAVDEPWFMPMKIMPRLRALLAEPVLKVLTLSGKPGEKVLAVDLKRKKEAEDAS